MPVLSPETRPDGPGFSRDFVFWPEGPERTIPGQFRSTFGLPGFDPAPLGGKSVCLTAGLRPDGPGGPGRRPGVALVASPQKSA